jgi:predicted nucleic acid-binding protein
VISNTSPLQYLYQLGLLQVLPALVGRILVPPAVLQELAVGQALGISLPDLTNLDWVAVRRPASMTVLPLVTDLGPGETEVLALGMESTDAVVLLDDALARRVAVTFGIRHRGTLGVLLDAKRAGLVPTIAPLLDQLQSLRFWLHPRTRAALLELAGEST